jgi:Flp pilus assembly pilin Flp
MQAFKKFASETDAATAVEYSVMMALILMSVFGTVATMGQQHASTWGTIVNSLTANGVGS